MEFVTIKIDKESRKRLRFIAVAQGKKQYEVLDDLLKAASYALTHPDENEKAPEIHGAS